MPIRVNIVTVLYTIITISKAEFRGLFPYLDKLQDIGFMLWVESQSDYQKFNIMCSRFYSF